MDSSLKAVYWGLAGIFGLIGLTSLIEGFSNHAEWFGALLMIAFAAGFGYAAKRKEKSMGIGSSNTSSGAPAKPTGFICRECGTINRSAGTEEEGGRSVVVFILLLCLAIIPGLLYWGIKSKAKKHRVCSGCGAKDSLVPLESPVGNKLWNEWHKSEPV